MCTCICTSGGMCVCTCGNMCTACGCVWACVCQCVVHLHVCTCVVYTIHVHVYQETFVLKIIHVTVVLKNLDELNHLQSFISNFI